MSAQPIILVAGWGHIAAAMNELQKELARDFNVYITSTNKLWQRGQRYDNKAPYLTGLVSLIKDIGKKPIIAGWSMGGMVALETACLHPELMSRLVLVSSTAKFCSGNGYHAGVHVQQVRAMSLGLKHDISRTLTDFYDQVSAPVCEQDSILKQKVKTACLLNADELYCGLSYLQQCDLRKCLGGIAVPALIVHGKQDRIVPWQAGDFLAKKLPVSRLSLHNEIGHALPILRPKTLASEITEFLENL